MYICQSSKVFFAAVIFFNAVFVHGGFCNWGPDGTAATSVCEGGAQGGDWCNTSQDQCESGCGGKWCTESFCNWGPDGTATTSVCEGGAQGGDWCNANRDQCESGCGGKWCSSTTESPPPDTSGPVEGGSCSEGWTAASWTYYESYPRCCKESPNYDASFDTMECDEYSGCSYIGDFAYIGHKSYDYVRSNNLIAFFSTAGDNQSFANKRIAIAAAGKTVEAVVADTCGDSDCDGCCTQNAAPSGYLVDMEYQTVINNYGSINVVAGQVCWKILGDAPAANSGFCNWGHDGTAATSVCEGGAQGGDWCNANQEQCELGCEGKWCSI